MFIRPIKHLKTLQKVQLPIQISATCSYATLKVNSERFLKVLQIKPICSYPISVRYASEQLNPKVKHEGYVKHGFEHFMAKLESSYQSAGLINNDNLLPVINGLKENVESGLTKDQGLFLLNLSGCCIPSLSASERMSHFQTIWEHLQLCNMITKDHYHTMLQVLQYNRAPLKDHKIFLQEYEKLNGKPNDIYTQLLAVAGSSGNIKQATEILAEMRTLQIPLTEYDFNSLVLAHARANDMSGMQMVLDSMRAADIAISTATQSTLIASYIENGVETKAFSLLEEFHGQFQNHEVLKMLQSIIKCAEISQNFVIKLMNEFDIDYVKGPEVPISLRRICIELLHNGKLDTAVCIIDTLPTPIFQENQDVDTYGVFLLNALFRANCEPEKIIEIAKQLEDSSKNTRALHIAAEIALKRNPPVALKIFRALMQREQPIRPHYFWPLIMYNFRKHNEAGIIRSLKIMEDFKVDCDRQTIVQYVIPRLSTIVTNPQMALKQLDAAGVRTSLVLTPIISHMLLQNKWYDVAPIVEPYTTKINTLDLISPLRNVAVNVRATKRYHQFAKLLNALANKRIDRKQDFIGQFLIELFSKQSRICSDLSSCQRFLNEIHKIGLNISPSAARTLENLLSEKTIDSPEDLQTIKQKLKEMTKKDLNLDNFIDPNSASASSFIKHPRDMTYDELECHLVELDAKQMNTRGVLRRLLQICVRDNRLERAVEIKNKCAELNMQISPGMLASTLELYTKQGDLDNAEKTMQLLQRTFPGFNIDEHKFIDYASLLVKSGQLDKAKEMLEQRSLNHKIIGGDYILKNVWNLLTNVAQLAATSEDLPKERNLTRETYAFLQKLDYCRTQNAILGPIVRERLLRGDLNGAIEELKQLAHQYKRTPLQFELFSLVVRLCNGDEKLLEKYNCTAGQAQQYLADITDVVTKVHGVANMNSGLLLAFAESGSDNQLRRLLITPEFCINEELLLRNCEHLGQEGAVRTLLRLARGARGLNRLINEQNIYKMLLDNFIKSNNYQAALNLYDRLEADDELKISQDFLNNLVALLKANNIEIPSNVALRAHII